VVPFYRAVGEIPRRRHVQFYKPDGGLYFEELMGEEGFSDDSALLYHINPAAAAIVESSVYEAPTWRRSPNLPFASATLPGPQPGWSRLPSARRTPESTPS
jgi:homogentisate 1,2-dioxygenase